MQREDNPIEVAMPITELLITFAEMILLKNKTKATSRVGYAVIIDPTDNQSFLYATPNSVKVIGIVMESVPYRGVCKIATIGDKAKVYVSGNVVKGDILRLSKTTDRASLGASVIAKTGDAPYVRIGEALNPGRGLISCILDFIYSASTTSISGIVTPTTFPYTIKIIDTLIICDSAIAVQVNLPPAVGNGRQLKISSIGVGAVTIEGSGTDDIDDELNQIITQWDTIVIIDYITGSWKII